MHSDSSSNMRSIFHVPPCSDTVPPDALRKITRIFSHRVWKGDEQKLVNEEVSARGVKVGGHYMYAVRKLRELPSTDVGFARMLTLKCLPVYNAPPLPGQLIDDFDSFILNKMKSLRKAMRLASQGSVHTGTIPSVDSLSVNTPMVCAMIPSSSSAFVPFVREPHTSFTEGMLKRKADSV